VVATVFASGPGASPTTATAFLGPTASVVVGANQKVFVDSSKALGAFGTPASGLNLYICYQLGGGAVTTVGGGSLGQQVPANTRILFSLSAVITGLAAGTYNVGLCGNAAVPANWTNNEWGYTSALVTL
jgi:hypothetical protein